MRPHVTASTLVHRYRSNDLKYILITSGTSLQCHVTFSHTHEPGFEPEAQSTRDKKYLHSNEQTKHGYTFNVKINYLSIVSPLTCESLPTAARTLIV